jgi:hypothetical protein
MEKVRVNRSTLWRKFALLASGCVLLSFCFLATHFMEKGYYYSQRQFDEELGSLRDVRGHHDWWPIWITGERLPSEISQNVEIDGRSVLVTSWEAERRIFQVSGGDVTQARLRTLYYPHWRASAGGRELSTQPGADGALIVSLPSDACTVVVEFREPLRVQLAGVITALGWILIVAFLIFNWRKSLQFYAS